MTLRNPASATPVAIKRLRFQGLERAVEKRMSYMRFLNVHPAYERWRVEPRFRRLHGYG